LKISHPYSSVISSEPIFPGLSSSGC